MKKRQFYERGLISTLAIFMLATVAFFSILEADEVFADLVLAHGQVVTVDNDILKKIQAREYKVKKMKAQFPIYNNGAVAIRGNVIVAVGPTADVLEKWKGPKTKVVDLKGKVIIPGLMDSHCHPMGLGNDLKYGIDLTMAMSTKDIMNTVDDFIKKNNVGTGGWILGSRWDEYKYSKMATRWDLDKVTTQGQLVEFDRVYRGKLYNTEALKRILEVDDEDPSTWPKWWTKDPIPEDIKADPAAYCNIDTWEKVDHILREERFIKNLNKTVKVPTGVFIGRFAPSLITDHPNYRKLGPQPLPFEEQVIGIKRTSNAYLRLGLTAIRSAESVYGYNTRVYQEGKARGYLKIRLMEILHGIYYSPKEHSVDFIKKDLGKLHIARNMDNRYLRWRGAKYYSDGGCGSRSAWLSEPFVNPEKFGEKSPNYGIPITSNYEERRNTYLAALEHGMDLNTHTCGDKAMRFTIDLYIDLMNAIKKGEIPNWKARLEAKTGEWDFRWAIEHAYFPIEPKTYSIDDLAKYNIIAHVQPVFGWQEGAAFLANIGPERMARWVPLKSYFEHGVICPNGSDYWVTTHNPWVGIYFMLTRKIQSQKPLSFGVPSDQYPDETVGISEALISACAMGPYSTFAEDWKGSIKAGHVADLVILDLKDIFELEKNPKLLWEMDKRILATLVDGEVRFLKSGFTLHGL